MITLPLSATERTALQKRLTQKNMTVKLRVSIGQTDSGVAMELVQAAVDKFGVKHVVLRPAAYERKLFGMTITGATFRILDLEGDAAAVAKFVLHLDTLVEVEEG